LARIAGKSAQVNGAVWRAMMAIGMVVVSSRRTSAGCGCSAIELSPRQPHYNAHAGRAPLAIFQLIVMSDRIEFGSMQVDFDVLIEP
jgi:ABC-type proline/glycine betaine transport system permease subunit